MRLSPRLGTAVRRIAATTSALLVLTGAVALVAAGHLVPPPEPVAVGPGVVTVGAGPLSLVCAGPPRLATDDAGQDIAYDEEFGPSPSGVSTVVEGLVVARDDLDPGPATVTALDSGVAEPVTPAGDAGLVSVSSPTGPTVLRAEPTGRSAAFAAGASVSRADTGDLRGLVASVCQAPSTTTWLVGGMTALGSSARLTLTNPGDTPVSATVTMWGATGPLGSDTVVVVAAGQARTVLLETVSLEPRIAVRVDSDGGRIVASIQDSELRGVVPAGVDTVTAAADPATELTIGPLPLVESVIAGQQDPAVVRLLNPHDAPARVSLTLLGPDGEEPLPGAQDQVLEPGTVTDISLAGVPAGSYTVRVGSDLPVTGAAMLTRAGQAPEGGAAVLDRAWHPASVPVDHGLLTVPALGVLVEAAGIALANPGAEDDRVTLRTVGDDGARGEPVTVPVPAGATRVLAEEIDVGGAVAIEISGTSVLGSVALVVRAPDGELLAMLGLTPDADLEQSLAVRLGTS